MTLMTLLPIHPTEEGYYWFQDSLCEGPEIVKVQIHKDDLWVSGGEISFFLKDYTPLQPREILYFSDRIQEPEGIIFPEEVEAE